MNESETIARRLPQEVISSEEMLAERSRVLQEHGLTLESVFDTFRSEFFAQIGRTLSCTHDFFRAALKRASKRLR